MGNSSAPKYEFLILKRPSSPLDDLKTILRERRIKSQADELHFCSSYKDLYAEYTVRYNGEDSRMKLNGRQLGKLMKEKTIV